MNDGKHITTRHRRELPVFHYHKNNGNLHLPFFGDKHPIVLLDNI